ncbi:MAG: CoA pyrophosphatase [Sphingomonas bacterium]|nr:CoA pyrophosphatase [Sphingomonas bacterium]
MTLGERLAHALANADPQTIYLTGDSLELAAAPDPIAAAVLVAVTNRTDPGIILTKRTETMRRHAGQVAFPGGRIDPTDRDVIAAALREAEEEIALPPHRVDVIGTADRYRTGTGFDIVPVIGVVPPDLALIPSEAEVAQVFEVPLAYLFDPANLRRASAMWQGRERHFYEMEWDGHRIWGATAAMIVNLSRRLRWA